jgi:hypothetical protein
MNWNEIKQSIITDLQSRGLSNPNIRINALASLERLMMQNFKELIADPTKLRQIDKNEFKERLARHKANEKLNGAEDSVVNEIYYRI